LNGGSAIQDASLANFVAVTRHAKEVYKEVPKEDVMPNLECRAPADPFPPMGEPIDPPENPDVPIQEPDPEEPGQI
jgi:hypothetical protein